jgi:transposase
LKNNKRELLLSALLANPTIKAAAASVGIPETTAYNWLRKPDFSQEYKQRKRQAAAEASDYIQSKISAATQIIDKIMNDTDTPPQTRLNAAKTLLETAYKIVEQSAIIERIEALETLMGDNKR